VAGTPASRIVLAAGLTFLAAAIGITTLWFALDTRSRDELGAVLVPPLIVGTGVAAGWACVLGVGLLVQWSWARWWALLTFWVVSAISGVAVFDTVRRVVDGGTTPVPSCGSARRPACRGHVHCLVAHARGRTILNP
jgi:hypothetical protein